GEVDLVDLPGQLRQLRDLGLAVRTHHIQRVEAVVDVDAQTRPRLTLVPGRHVGGVTRQVTDVAVARLHDVPRPEVAGDRLCLRRRLDDDQTLHGTRHGSPCGSSRLDSVHGTRLATTRSREDEVCDRTRLTP